MDREKKNFSEICLFHKAKIWGEKNYKIDPVFLPEIAGSLS